jgi:AraC-like DNA-binding protein
VFGQLPAVLSYIADLRGMLRLAVRNRGLLADGLELSLVEDGRLACLRWSHPADAIDGGYGAELGAGVLVRSLRSMFEPEDSACGLAASSLQVPQADLFAHVEFAHQPLGPLSSYHGFFAVPVAFGCQSNALVFATGALDRLNPNAAPELGLFAQRHLDHLRRTLGVRSDVDELERVREAVTQNAVRGEFGSAALAHSLAMSPRSLQRRLAAEGTSARELLDEARLAHARELLRDRGLSIEEIAELLGYATERSFRRAFERWTGLSPAQARRDCALS